ncbi:MAG: TMEM175 family protein [Solirubrobacterales bacterium]
MSRRYDRQSAEFGRVLAFSDGLFAIAMTLLVVSITVPHISNGDSVHDLASALDDLSAAFVSFFISFAVIGRYWLAHHQFISLMEAMDGAIIGLNLIYLAFIAFLPFPTALLGEYFSNPLSVVIYAVAVAIVSGMEVVLFRHAYRAGLLRRQPSRAVYRFGILVSFAPVVFFLVSIPFAFVSTTLAVCIWFLTAPFGALAERWAPEGTDELLH